MLSKLMSHHGSSFCWQGDRSVKRPEAEDTQTAPSDHESPRCSQISEIIHPAWVDGQQASLDCQRDHISHLCRRLQNRSSHAGLMRGYGGHDSNAKSLVSAKSSDECVDSHNDSVGKTVAESTDTTADEAVLPVIHVRPSLRQDEQDVAQNAE